MHENNSGERVNERALAPLDRETVVHALGTRGKRRTAATACVQVVENGRSMAER